MEITGSHISIRLADHSDEHSLIRLAALDSAPAPRGAVLVAEAGGQVIAAHSLGDERTISDPFSATANARELLELRATQLPPEATHPRRRHLPRSLLRRRAVRPPLAA